MTHIVRYATGEGVRVGVLTDGEVRPVTGLDSMAALLTKVRLVAVAARPKEPNIGR